MRTLFVIPLIALAAVAVTADPQSVTITGGKADKERAGLIRLSEDAEALAALGKTADAVKKLLD